MMLMCRKCGRTFDAVVVDEHMELDCVCGGSVAEMNVCSVCGELFLPPEDEGWRAVCDGCFDRYAENVEFCIKQGEKAKENVAVNGFVASVMTEAEINEVLLAHIRQRKDISGEDFAEEDRCWFDEMIEKEVKKNG